MDEPYDDVDVDAELAFNDQYQDAADDEEQYMQFEQSNKPAPPTQPLKSIDTNANHRPIVNGSVSNGVQSHSTAGKRKLSGAAPDKSLSYHAEVQRDTAAVTNDHAAHKSPVHKKARHHITTAPALPKRTYVQRTIPLVGLYTTAVARDKLHSTVSSHRSVFMAVQSEAEITAEIQKRKAQQAATQQFLGGDATAIAQYMSVIDDQLLQRTIELSKREQTERQYDSDSDDTPKQAQHKRSKRAERTKQRDSERTKQQQLIGDRLWVDKYTAKMFTDLLSPEPINREVLSWLRSWDTYVFGKKRIVTERTLAVKATNALNQLRDSTSVNSKRRTSVSAHANQTATDGDSGDARPTDKVILLCGQPGIGKTTIAHIIAKLAGYNPFEINASDDRTAETLMNKIRSATEMQSVMGNKKPNCIILDEIDGALGDNTNDDKGAINALIKLINAKPRSTKQASSANADNGNTPAADDSDEESEEQTSNVNKPAKAASSRKHDDGFILRRPIICICNDQYVPALRPLRQIARVFVFEKPSKQKLVDRLKYISRQERIKVDDRVLNALVELTDYDVRSCLNTLHFVRNNTDKLTLNQLHSLDIARKDMTKGLFSILEGVMHKRVKAKPNSFNEFGARHDMKQINVQQQVGGASNELDSLYNQLLDYGEYQRVTDGVYHNYLRLPFADPTYDKTVQCSDWLSYYNMFETQAMSEMDFSLSGYVPLANLAINQLICNVQNNRCRMELPKQLFELRQRHSSNIDLLNSYMAQPHNAFRLNGYTLSTITVDALSSIVHICNPLIRSINMSLLTPAEKVALHRLVNTMCSMGLTYKQLIDNSGYTQTINTFHLEPPVDTLLAYSDDSLASMQTPQRYAAVPQYSSPQRIDLSNRVRQLIAHQITLEQARRLESTMSGGMPVELSESSQPASTAVNTSTMSAEQTSAANGQQGTDNFMAAYKARNAYLDLAKQGVDANVVEDSRRTTFLSASQAAGAKHVERVKYNLHFKYNDGHTNAVRRPVYVKQFMS